MPLAEFMSSLIWIVFLLFLFYPTLQRKIIETKRLAKIKYLERKYNARIITMIHRMETLSFFGIPLAKYITVEDAESILRAIRTTPPNKKIILILHTPGGIAFAAQQIALALKKHPNKIIVVVPHYAMSGGTLIALAADEIWMDENAVLGPIDPIVFIDRTTGQVPAVSVIKAVKMKGKKANEKYIILADVAEKAISQISRFIRELLSERYPEEQINKIIDELISGKYTHDYPITVDILKDLGINVKTDVPRDFYDLLELYPQPKIFTSVEYVKKEKKSKGKSI